MEAKPEVSKADTVTQQFNLVLNTEPSVDINALKKLAWKGIPHNLRPTVWKLLLNYLPSESASRAALISTKREDYRSYVEAYFGNLDSNEPTHDEKLLFRCFELDAPRMRPTLPLFQNEIIQQIMIRVAWIWYSKYSADKGQGMHTALLLYLQTALIAVFLQEYVENIDYTTFEVPGNLEEIFGREERLNLEADVYWCLCGILEKIFQNLSFEKDQIEAPFNKLKEILEKNDLDLINHFEKQEMNLKLFGYRWIFFFLLADLPLMVGVRLLDTYITDEQGFGVLHCYLCYVILEKESQKLKEMDFNELILFLTQNLTKELSEEDIQLLIQDANAKRELNGDTKSSLLTQ